MAYTIDDLKSIMSDEEAERLAKAQSDKYSPRSITATFPLIPWNDKYDQKTQKAVHRLNSFGSLYYFAVSILRKRKLQKNPDISKNLHYLMCKTVEKDGIQDVIEIPRDHFKSTIYSECFAMWRTLPFGFRDEELFRSFGGYYAQEEFILWMKRAHRQDYRWLLISEVIKNAIKLGVKISSHYESNDIFRYVFNDIIPDTGGTWNNESMHHKRTSEGMIHGEGTYDFIGVGGALQSRHYDGSIEDDLVGKEALKSEIVMNDTIDYHKLLVGAFDSDVSDGGRQNEELVVGNRWAYNDLNSWIRHNEPYFSFTTHSALGGCCKLHPYGTPIFPEGFSLEKLEQYKRRLGSYFFSCQFLNTPINPNEVKINKKDLMYYEFVPANSDEVITHKKKRIAIRHRVAEGAVVKDIMPRTLRRYMIVDPNHSENKGRCRHAITVTGVMDNPRRVYLLSVWAKATSIGIFINEIFQTAKAWKLNEVWLETIAAQKYLKYHLDYAISISDDPWMKQLVIKELQTPRTANAKKMRIEGLVPIIERHELWVNIAGQSEFMEEIESYPNGQLRDVLDTLGYGPQVWNFEQDEDEIKDDVLAGLAEYERRTKNTSLGY
jgi:hypothetical protein